MLFRSCFDNQKRSTPERGTKVFIHKFIFLEKQIARFYSDELMKFRLELEARSTMEDLRVRLEIRTPEGTNVGMSESKAMINVQEDSQYEYDFSYDVSNLAEGFYTLRLTLFVLNDMGKHVGYDETTAIPFEVVENESNRTDWLPQYWGRVKLPSVKKNNEKKIV